MNNIVTKGILLGLGILSASTIVTAPASAQPRFERGVFERRTVIRHHNNDFRPRPNRTRSVRGVVTRDLTGNDFLLRQNNGRTVRVIVRRGEPRRLSRGDLVEAHGRFEGNTFRAQRVVVIRNRNR